MKEKKYKIENNEVIFARTATEFITKLRKGSYFDYKCSNIVYKMKFAQRYMVITGNKINCDLKDDDAFVAELLKYGFIKSIQEYPYICMN